MSPFCCCLGAGFGRGTTSSCPLDETVDCSRGTAFGGIGECDGERGLGGVIGFIMGF